MNVQAPSKLVLSLLMLVQVACGDDPPTGTGPHGSDHDIAFAVVSTDFTATSISLLGPDGEVVEDDYINSGSASAGLVTALSGDVALPTRSGESGILVIIDRYKADVITRIRVSDGEILGQVKTHTPPASNSDSAYSSNPHDYVYVDASTAWVARYEPNLDPGVPALERGTDLLRIDPTTMERSEERIDLSIMNATGTHVNPDTGKEEEVAVYARPQSIVRAGDTLVVGLARMAFDFSAVGEGAVAVVDLTTRKATDLALEGFCNCGIVVPVVDAVDRVLVSCTGSFLADPRETAGLVELHVANGKATIARTWRAKEHAADPLSVMSPVSLGGARVGVVAMGVTAMPASEGSPAVEGAPDRFSILDLERGTQAPLFEAEHAYVLGGGVFDAARGLLLVPDASVDGDMRPTSGVRRFRAQGQGFSELPVVKVATSTGMTVEQIAPL